MIFCQGYILTRGQKDAFEVLASELGWDPKQYMFTHGSIPGPTLALVVFDEVLNTQFMLSLPDATLLPRLNFSSAQSS